MCNKHKALFYYLFPSVIISTILLFVQTNKTGQESLVHLPLALIEIAGFAFAYYLMHNHPKSRYDFVVVFVIFGLLLIGIGQLSFSSTIFSAGWTKPLGTASILLALNHYRINVFLQGIYGNGYAKTEKVFVLPAAVVGTCFVVWVIAKLLECLFNKIAKTNLYKKEA